MMRAGRNSVKMASAPHRQRGVVLLITLIILVAMTLAGIGMMRSVDTGNIVAGNMAFRQATTLAGDAATSAGFIALMTVANSGNTNDKAILDSDDGSACPIGATPTLCPPGGNSSIPGYASSPLGACEVDSTCPVVANAKPWWAVDTNWNNAVTLPAIQDPTGGTIATVSYLIHRMCKAPGVSPSGAGQLCQTVIQNATGCSKTQLLPCTTTGIFYRITTRAQGPRDTVAYSQTLVLIAE